MTPVRIALMLVIIGAAVATLAATQGWWVCCGLNITSALINASNIWTAFPTQHVTRRDPPRITLTLEPR